MRVVAWLCVGLLVGLATPSAQQGSSAQQLFESGQYDAALQAIGAQRDRGAGGPAETFLAGQVLLKMNQDDRARSEFRTLAGGGTPWTLIGESALAILDGNNQRGLEAASQAAQAAPDSSQAFYQLGLAKARFDDWGGSADAFHRATELDADFAYAHYYSGLAYSRIKRVDRTSEHMERFLKLAPRAPERPAVETLMRTLRGR